MKFSVKVKRNKRSVKDDSLQSVFPVPRKEDLRDKKTHLKPFVTGA